MRPVSIPLNGRHRVHHLHLHGRSSTRGASAEYFLGLWWADYLATGIILAFVAREAVESYHELHEEELAVHALS